MISAFENLCDPGKPLKAEPPDSKEIAGLIRSGKARLKDAAVKGLALESASIWARSLTDLGNRSEK
jgi:hypothetical protein